MKKVLTTFLSMILFMVFTSKVYSIKRNENKIQTYNKVNLLIKEDLLRNKNKIKDIADKLLIEERINLYNEYEINWLKGLSFSAMSLSVGFGIGNALLGDSMGTPIQVVIDIITLFALSSDSNGMYPDPSKPLISTPVIILFLLSRSIGLITAIVHIFNYNITLKESLNLENVNFESINNENLELSY